MLFEKRIRRVTQHGVQMIYHAILAAVAIFLAYSHDRMAAGVGLRIMGYLLGFLILWGWLTTVFGLKTLFIIGMYGYFITVIVFLYKCSQIKRRSGG